MKKINKNLRFKTINNEKYENALNSYSEKKLKNFFNVTSYEDKNEIIKSSIKKNISQMDSYNKKILIDIDNKEIRERDREIKRLEYVNSCLLVSIKKRDEMLFHIMEENRKLKDFCDLLERTLNGMNKSTLSPRKVGKKKI